MLLGTPYVAATLEPSELPADVETFVEPLVVNLAGVDCTTCVEYVTAARLAGMTEIHAADSAFLASLQRLRYRGGQRGNYATRKHYFSEWISDAVEQGLLQEVTSQLHGALPLQKKIDFMSRNPRYYPQLQRSEALLHKIRQVEQQLSAEEVCYLPVSSIEKAFEGMQHGDIVAFLTNKEGLDVQHVGLVWRPSPSDAPRLLHASTTHRQVTVDKRTIAEYAKAQKSVTGVRIIRLKK